MRTTPNPPGTGDPHRGPARRNRGVRFSDPEWEEVRQAAKALNITPAEFVRKRILELVRNPSPGASVPIPADLAPLIERSFRYSYVLATRMRDEMVARGQAEEVEKLVSEARALQDSLRRGDG